MVPKPTRISAPICGSPGRRCTIPKPGTFNSVGLDQVVALHTKQYCRQPSLVLSIDAGTGFLSRTGTISYNLEGGPFRQRTTLAASSTGCSVVTIASLQSERDKLQHRIKLVDAVAESAIRSTGNWASPTASGWTNT